jgi:hypothetical protein
LNKRTVLLRQAAAQLDPAAGDLRLTPKATLEANMHHWRAAADAIECEIQAQLRAGVPREQLSKQRKMADDCRTACDAAAKLAPYIHPRLGAVPVPNDDAGNFVIVVPPVIHASDEWVRAANQARLINVKPTNGNGSDE